MRYWRHGLYLPWLHSYRLYRFWELYLEYERMKPGLGEWLIGDMVENEWARI